MTAPRLGPVGHPERDVADLVTAAIRAVDGLTLMLPLRAQALRWTGADAVMAVTLDRDRVEVRLVAHTLPLPPLLDQAATAVRAALRGTGWERAPLRLVVAELTTAAFTRL